MPTSWSADLTSIQRAGIFQYLIERLRGSGPPRQALQCCPPPSHPAPALHLSLPFLSTELCSVWFSGNFKTKILVPMYFFLYTAQEKTFFLLEEAGWRVFSNFTTLTTEGWAWPDRLCSVSVISPAFSSAGPARLSCLRASPVRNSSPRLMGGRRARTTDP